MLLALALALSGGAIGEPPPSIEHAARLHGPALVAVYSAGGAPRPGFFVAGSGVLVAVVGPDVVFAVVELPSGERRRAQVLVRDDDGLALLALQRLEKDPTFPALGLGQGVPPATSSWVLGLGLAEGRAAPSVGGLRRVEPDGRWRLDLPLDPGAAVIADERVIGVVVERKGTTGCVAVPVERVMALVHRLP